MTYDPAKKTTVYAEDLKNLGDEITAVEEYLEPSKTHEFDPVLLDLFTGNPIDLGTDGECKVRWQRVGNMINASFALKVGTDYEPAGRCFAAILAGAMPAISYLGTITGAGSGGGLIENVMANKTSLMTLGVTEAPGTLVLLGIVGGDVSNASKLVRDDFPIEATPGWTMAGNFAYWTEEV